MKIALDWDDTFTRDPEFWAGVIRSALQKEHEVRIVTFRSSDQIGDIKETLLSVDLDNLSLVTTGGVQKMEYCESIGWVPDVWIDDSPEFIVANGNPVPNLTRLALEENT